MKLNEFDSRAGAALAACDVMTSALRESLEQSEIASVVVSGGNTPRRLMTLLSMAALPWDRVQVTVTDEREVPPDDPMSNERTVRECLLQGKAGRADFVRLEPGIEKRLSLPAACVLVGMGDDGHIASLFPDLVNLDSLLSPEGEPGVRLVRTAASPVARRTMTLSLLLATRRVILLAFGEQKRRILDLGDGLPVHALLAQQHAPVQICWAP